MDKLMPEIELLIFLLASVGTTAIIASSKLLSPVRNLLIFNMYLYEAIGCYQCVGFWAGLTLSLISGDGLWPAFLLGCTTSLLAFILRQVLNLMFALQEYLEND